MILLRSLVLLRFPDFPNRMSHAPCLCFHILLSAYPLLELPPSIFCSLSFWFCFVLVFPTPEVPRFLSSSGITSSNRHILLYPSFYIFVAFLGIFLVCSVLASPGVSVGSHFNPMAQFYFPCCLHITTSRLYNAVSTFGSSLLHAWIQCGYATGEAHGDPNVGCMKPKINRESVG